jgi:hypothetical protein
VREGKQDIGSKDAIFQPPALVKATQQVRKRSFVYPMAMLNDLEIVDSIQPEKNTPTFRLSYF